MKHWCLVFAGIFWISAMMAQVVPAERVLKGAEGFMEVRTNGVRVASWSTIRGDSSVPVGYLIHFEPAGFMFVSASERSCPVYGYSCDGQYDLGEPERSVHAKIIASDLSGRIRGWGFLSGRQKAQLRNDWELFMRGGGRSPGFQQWPPEGSTSTGGWVATNWTQSSPYNQMCPMDLNSGSRSVAGCPATAMAQILNYHRDINQTRLDDGDDYYHSYGSGNSYLIDDDHLARGFPSFDSLNYWLDTLETVYRTTLPISNPMKAALTFACGVAARQVYSSQVSGTFGLDQAMTAFERFGFPDARLLWPPDTTINHTIAENMKTACPVQLGLLVSGGSGGHNVVVDGYNTDEFYHFNFGWGGQANGWYTLPPENIPYNLTIIEGAITDIHSSFATRADPTTTHEKTYKFFPNPFTCEVRITGPDFPASIEIYDAKGKLVFNSKTNHFPAQYNLSELPPGNYHYVLTGNNDLQTTGTLIRK